MRISTFSVCSVLWSFAVAALTAVPLQARQGLLFAPVEVVDAGGTSHRFLVQLDTGSAATLIDPRALEQGLWSSEKGTTGIQTLDGHRESLSKVKVNRLRVGGQNFDNQVFPVVKVREVYPTPAPGQDDWPVLGILGADLLFSSSLSLSIHNLSLDWSNQCPWEEDSQVDLVWIPGNLWALEGQLDHQRTAYLIDTGAFEDWYPLSSVQSEFDASPRAWLQWKSRGADSVYTATGPLTSATPLDPAVARKRLISGLPRAVSPGIGTETLSSWDLWFEIKGYRNAVLHLKRSAWDAQAQFTGSVAAATWGLEPDTWGFRVDADTGRVSWLALWGDGSAVVPDLQWDDTLVSVNSVSWGPSGLQELPAAPGTITTRWQRGEAFLDRAITMQHRDH